MVFAKRTKSYQLKLEAILLETERSENTVCDQGKKEETFEKKKDDFSIQRISQVKNTHKVELHDRQGERDEKEELAESMRAPK